MRLMVALLSVAFGSAAVAQTEAPAGQTIADAATFGAVATLAPLCGLRDETWAFDLRRAAMQTATGSTATDDAALSQAPGSDQVAAALGYGDMEALEDFAADTPAETCASLRQNPALTRADAAVDAFRRRRNGKPVGQVTTPGTIRTRYAMLHASRPWDSLCGICIRLVGKEPS